MNAARIAERTALYQAIDAAADNHLPARRQVDPPVFFFATVNGFGTREAICVRGSRYWQIVCLHQPPGIHRVQRAVVDDYGTLVVVP